MLARIRGYFEGSRFGNARTPRSAIQQFTYTRFDPREYLDSMPSSICQAADGVMPVTALLLHLSTHTHGK
jgi:hypothetical protein